MKYRELGRTGWKISSIGFGAWEIGSKVTDQEALAVLHRAVELGVNFIDTADVYGSEHLVGRLLRERPETTGIGVGATIALLHQLGTAQPCATVGIQLIEPPDT